MNGQDEPHTRMRTAMMLSIAAHLCVLLVLAELLRAAGGFPTANAPENGPGAALTLFVHREPKPRPRAAAVRTPPPRVVAVRQTAVPAQQPRLRREPPPPAAAGEAAAHRTLALAPRSPLTARPGPALAVAAGSDAPLVFHASRAPLAAPAHPPTPAAAPTPAPTPVPTVVPAPVKTPVPTNAPTAVAAGNFGGLFSQNYPPAFSATAQLDAIRSRLSRPVHIRVDVDETGRATDVHFVQPVADPELAQEVRSTLLALRYVPADCNGLHCEGTLEIAY